jgi:hypothetical protein
VADLASTGDSEVSAAAGSEAVEPAEAGKLAGAGMEQRRWKKN